MIRVGYQGEPGAFSEEAAFALFGDEETRGFRTFDALVEAVAGRDVDYGLLPCENTIAGSIARAYDLLFVHPELAIVDETTHRVEQTLIGTGEATLENLETVASHAVALDQCRRFFSEHPQLEPRVVDDTAGAIREIVERADPKAGAIGPALAARRYGAKVLMRGVADEVENYTRFFVIARGRSARRAAGRATISFVLPHASGSLYGALGLLSERGVNLRSLVARPRPGRPFEYVFHADIESITENRLREVASALGPQTRVLGWY